MNSIKIATLSLLASFYIPYAYAIDPTSEQPITIESDTATLDDSNGLSTYTGNVVIKQGESQLKADEISVEAVDRKISTIIAKGLPAHFIQKSESIETHGYANIITYTSGTGTLTLKEKAQLIQDTNSFEGELIEYDIAKKAIKAKGNEKTGERVKIEYHPGTKPNESSEPEPPIQLNNASEN